MSLKIYGASDDLLELQGDIQEEIYVLDDEKQYCALSDGTVLSVQYDEDGLWRLKRIVAGSCDFEKEEGDIEKDTNDVVTLSGTTIRWAVIGKNLVR